MPPSPAPPPPPPPAPPLAADESPPSDPHRAVPTPFLTKTYHMVDDPTVNDIISWNENGSTFIVWRPADFAHDLLPKYFKHNNFSSFVRQLNTYGFRKIVPDRWEFSNDCFRKGEKRLLCDIHRRKIAAAAAAPVNRVGSPANSVEEQVISSNSSPTPLPPADLAEENDRLRKENRKLANELSKMKNLCSNIFVLMSKFAGSSPESPPPPPPEAAAAAAWCCESSPMLFGVSIGEKRCREMEECEELPLLTASTVKTEPLEVPLPAAAPPPEVAERRPWVVYCPRPQRVCNGKHRVLMEDDGAHVS